MGIFLSLVGTAILISKYSLAINQLIISKCLSWTKLSSALSSASKRKASACK